MSEELALYGTQKRRMDFFIPCVPPRSTAQASIRIMKRGDGTQFVGKFANSKGKKIQGEFMMLLREHMPSKPFEGPLRLTVRWHYPWRKSEPKRNRRHGFMWCDTKPDCSNIVKLFEDCMTRSLFWTDDAQVAILHFEKQWCDAPGIGVTIEEL